MNLQYEAVLVLVLLETGSSGSIQYHAPTLSNTFYLKRETNYYGLVFLIFVQWYRFTCIMCSKWTCTILIVSTIFYSEHHCVIENTDILKVKLEKIKLKNCRACTNMFHAKQKNGLRSDDVLQNFYLSGTYILNLQILNIHHYKNGFQCLVNIFSVYNAHPGITIYIN